MTVRNINLKNNFILLLLFVVPFFTTAQQQYIKQYNHAFYQHLLENKLYVEIENYLQHFSGYNDTATYILGRYYISKNEKESYQKALILNDTILFSETSAFYVKAKLYAELLKILLDDSERKNIPFLLIENDSLLSSEVNNIFNAGIKLHHNDTVGVKYLLASCGNYFSTKKPVDLLTKVYNKPQSKLYKNKYKAALLSVILPGLGKAYSGRKYEGLATLIQTAAIGAVFVENAMKANSVFEPRVLFFGGLFSVFYLGNIIGSYHTAKRVNKYNKSLRNEEITVAMYMLLRNTFRD